MLCHLHSDVTNEAITATHNEWDFQIPQLFGKRNQSSVIKTWQYFNRWNIMVKVFLPHWGRDLFLISILFNSLTSSVLNFSYHFHSKVPCLLRSFVFKLQSSELLHCVVFWLHTIVLEEHAACFFRWCKNTGDHNLNFHCHENLKTYKLNYLLLFY
jgi:hypothetical protein